MLAFLDRGNIGNAEIAGMQQDLKLTSSQYAWFSTIFYITYNRLRVLSALLEDISTPYRRGFGCVWMVWPEHGGMNNEHGLMIPGAH
jgi:sugar phosphate permease